MKQLPDIKSLREEFSNLLEKHADTIEKLENVRIAWLGRNGRITRWLKELGNLSLQEKKFFGSQLNDLKKEFIKSIGEKQGKLESARQSKLLEKEALDISLPGTPHPTGRRHVLSTVRKDLTAIFRALGFVCADGPEIESDFYNFGALNIPPDHPARDLHDTFYLDRTPAQLPLPHLEAPPGGQEPALLRTHTSPVQIRVLQTYPPPIAIVAPGRVYRREAVDATHSAVFHQLEGLLVDQGVSFADLTGTLSRFAQQFCGDRVKTRFRPSFFPFTEPSAEMDISCLLCDGAGCAVCKRSGWLEILGAGMVHPNVFAAVDLNPDQYAGFAFGMGIERLAMIKYGVDDLRLFYENDVRFLQQF